MQQTIILFVLFSYLLGSISSAVLICWAWKLPDPRTVGSNNPGATNVYRIGGKFPAVFALVGDLLKGGIAVVIAKCFNYGNLEISLVMLAVFFGHLFPVFFKFRGGKGVATAFGALLAFSWQLGGLLLFSWLTVFAITRVSSLSAIISSLIAVIYAWTMFEPIYGCTITFMMILLLFRHKSNIWRLFKGQELGIS